MAAIRVLQVLADTDATDANLAAVEVHAVLAGAGVEMRTLALGPGRRGQLAGTVPVIAPSRRSIAAHTQLHEEQRWAQVLMLRGTEVASVAALVPGLAARILVLGAEPQGWSEGRRVGRLVRRLATGAASVVVGWGGAAEIVEAVLGVDAQQIRVIPTGVPGSGGPTTQAARSAALAMAGIDAERPTVRVLRNSADRTRSGVSRHVRFDASGFRQLIGESAELLSASLEPELARAAADMVVELDGRAGPSPELLRSVLAGAVAITPRWPALAALVEDDVTGCTIELPLTTEHLVGAVRPLVEDSDRRKRLAAAGTARAAQDFTATELVPRWLETLRSALPSTP